uniref:helix-turn-helix domain-containing protein n=1 Tax=Polaribacter sp. TaxID=1920175 RepID=UPI004047BF0D
MSLEVLNKRFVNKKGLCEYLDVSIGKVEKMMYNDGLKYVKFGRNVRFDINDVNDYMNKRKVS